MPYESVSGSFERASRTGHAHAAVKAAADRAQFYVPAENVSNVSWLAPRIRKHAFLPHPDPYLRAALAIDGSRIVVPVREGLPSVRYGYAQASAAFLNLEILESQRAERFVDPVSLAQAANTALVSLDLPTAGAYTRQGASIQESWRESIGRIFRSKRVEVNRLNQSLLDLLMLLHGVPGRPATFLDVNCPADACIATGVATPPAGTDCPRCGTRIYPTDALRIHEEVVEEGTNEEALGRLMQVVELLVLVGLATLLWEQARDTLLAQTLFIMDGPLAVYGPPAKLRARALEYFQAMSSATPSNGPYLCGIEKSGPLVDYARSLVLWGVLDPGDLLVVDADVIAVANHASNPTAYGSETYWGRKFVYRALDGRVVIPTVPPPIGFPYDDHGGQPDPAAYPTLPAILDVIDRTGSSMYRDGLIPVALAHGRAAFPIGVGTDVLRLVAREVLNLSSGHGNSAP